MKKRYLIPLAALGGLVLVGVGVSWYLDDIAAAALETGGQAAMGVTTTVEEVSLRPFAGSLTVERLVIGNPPGFETAHFAAIADVRCDFSLGAVFADKVEIPLLAIDGLDLNLEHKAQGANYDVILGNMKASGDKAPEDRPKDGKKWVIRELLIRDIMAHSDVALAGQKLSQVDVKIDEIRLTNVGEEAGGTSEGVLIATIVEATLLAVLKQGHKVLPEAVVNGLGLGLKQLPGLPAQALEIGGEAITVGGEVIEGATEGVSGVIEGLFGGKKKAQEPPKK